MRAGMKWITVFEGALLRIAGFKLAAPQWLTIEPTNVCNQSCPICGAAQGMKTERGYLPWDLFREITRQASALKPERIFLHARGEPLLHPRIVDMVTELSRCSFQTELFTNGDLLTPELASSLRRAGLGRMVISFPEVSEANTLSCRGRRLPEGYTAQLAQSLPAWDHAGGRAVLRVTVLPGELTDPISSIREFLFRWLTTPGVHRIDFGTYQPWPRHAIERYLPVIFSRPRRCQLLLHSITVLWDGRVTPCSYDVDGLLCMGSCSETSLARFFNGVPLRRWRRLVYRNSPKRPSLCKSCLVNRVPYLSASISKADLPSGCSASRRQWMQRQARRIFREIHAPLQVRRRGRRSPGFKAATSMQ